MRIAVYHNKSGGLKCCGYIFLNNLVAMDFACSCCNKCCIVDMCGFLQNFCAVH